MECAPPAAGFLYWVGASTIAYLALRASYSLFRAFQVWCVGNEALVGPRLGEWAGEWNHKPRPRCGPCSPVARAQRARSGARKLLQTLSALAGWVI